MANETPSDSKPPTLRHRRMVIGANVLVQIVAVLALLVMVNWLASRHYVRFDWTKAGYYQLSEKTKQVVAGLKDPVDIVVFLPPEDRQHEYVEKALEDARNLLKEFQFYGKANLHVEYVDPQRDLARAEQLVKEYNLDPRAPDVIIFASRGQHKYVRLDELVELDSSNPDSGETRVKAFKGEGLFLSAIQTVTEEESPKVYFLTGHGERDPEDFDQAEGYSELARYIKRDNILVQKWNLLENQALPTDASAIVIAGPHQAFTPSELNALEQYLKGKGRLLILLDPHKPTGLEALLKKWGVQVDDDLAMRQAGVLLGTEMLDVNAVAADYASHPITAKLSDTNTEFPYARSVRQVTPTESGTPDQPRVTELVKAAPAYWGETDPDTQHATFNPKTDIAGPLPLAVAVETSKPHGVDVDIGVTRMVVIGTSRFVDNSSLGGGNLDFFMNSLNWLLQREQLMAVSPKVPDEFRLDMSPSQQRAVYALVIGGLPLFVAIIGILVWLSRRK